MRNKKKSRPMENHNVPKERRYDDRIVRTPDDGSYLDTVKLNRLEQAFREWATASSRTDISTARRRILLIFLLIRYTGAKLSEVLRLDPTQDFDFTNQWVHFARTSAETKRTGRKVHLAEAVCRQIADLIDAGASDLRADPGFVRRKFYERAAACGFAKQLGAPEILRKSRAIELMQRNMPLPAVQTLLGHSTPNLTSAYVSFSEDDIQQVTRMVLAKESGRKTSARNTFFGKIRRIRNGDIQSQVELITVDGHRLTTVITNDSLHRLGLKTGKLITAEVKAPWVMLHRMDDSLDGSADNLIEGIVDKVTRGAINTEYIVRISDDSEVCALVTSASSRRLALRQGDRVRVAFNAYAVVLLAD